MTERPRYYGKFRGTVVRNLDENEQGRVEVDVPGIYAEGEPRWAMPCVPYAAPNKGMLLLPPVGAHVWVEFEGGDPDCPIWTGCYWNKGEAPTNKEASKVLLTNELKIELTDAGDAKLKIDIAGATITCSKNEIVINAGSGVVKVEGSKFDVLGGAAEVQ